MITIICDIKETGKIEALKEALLNGSSVFIDNSKNIKAFGNEMKVNTCIGTESKKRI